MSDVYMLSIFHCFRQLAFHIPRKTIQTTLDLVRVQILNGEGRAVDIDYSSTLIWAWSSLMIYTVWSQAAVEQFFSVQIVRNVAM